MASATTNVSDTPCTDRMARDVMQPLKMSIIPIALLTSLVVGCGRGQTPIPPGAQVVHVVATESEVRLDPASVQAGDVYLVLDEPVGGSFSFGCRPGGISLGSRLSRAPRPELFSSRVDWRRSPPR